MRTLKNLIVIVLFSLSFSCQKHDGLFYGNGSIQGYVYLQDTSDLSLPSILPDQQIYLNTSLDSNSFLFKTTTNKDGYFVINYLHQDSYYLMTKTLKDSLKYFGVTKEIVLDDNQVNKINIYVFPNITNGMILSVKDSLGGNLTNFTIKIYLSEIAAMNDDTTHVFRKSRTNANGIYKLYNVPSNTYYILAKDKLAGKTIAGKATINLPLKGIVKNSVVVE